MPKYYVTSGELKKVIDRQDYKTAAVDVFKNLDGETLGQVTLVSEKGFDSCCSQDAFFLTMNLLDESDKIGDYKFKEWD